MLVKDFMQELEARGIKAETKEIVKNGVKMQGVCIGDGLVRPTVYPEAFEETDPAAAVDHALDMVARQDIGIDPAQLMDPDYICSHVKVYMQRAGEEELVKRPWEVDPEIECYLALDMAIDGVAASCKVRPGLLQAAGLDADTVWMQAELNSMTDTELLPMGLLIESMMGAPEDIETGGPDLYVLTNRQNCRGAAAIMDHDALEALAKRHGVTRLFALPSSVHEWIIVPDAGGYDLAMLSAMVQDINAAQVDPVDQLADKAYTLTF